MWTNCEAQTNQLSTILLDVNGLPTVTSLLCYVVEGVIYLEKQRILQRFDVTLYCDSILAEKQLFCLYCISQILINTMQEDNEMQNK